MENVDISEILNSEGSIVSCVILHATAQSASSRTPPPQSFKNDDSIVTSSSVQEDVESSSPDVAACSSISDLETRGETSNNTLKQSEDLVTSNTIKNKDDSIITKNDNTNIEQDSDGNLQNKPKYELAHLVSQIDIDTTPKKRSVEKVLGGPFTFLGQYEDLGVVVMALRPSTDEEGAEEDGPPLNPHNLQPPLHDLKVRGDILMMKVEPEEDEEEEEADEVDVEDDAKVGVAENDSSDSKSAKEIVSSSDQGFFRNFTREEYLEFACRTDIVIPDTFKEIDEDNEVDKFGEVDESETNEDGENDDLDADINDDASYDDEDYDEEDGNYMEFDEEEEKVGMMNMLMAQILRKFREENGTGPDRHQLLQMRQALAMKLGVDVPAISDEESDDDNDDNEAANKQAEKKRSSNDAFSDSKLPERKRVRWSILSENEEANEGKQTEVQQEE